MITLRKEEATGEKTGNNMVGGHNKKRKEHPTLQYTYCVVRYVEPWETLTNLLNRRD